MILPRSINLLARSTSRVTAAATRHQLQRQPCFVRPAVSRRSFATAAQQQQHAGGNFTSLAHHFKQQQHLPYFLEYLMWVVFGSEALHLIWLKMEYKEYKEKTEHKIRLLKEIVERIENGQEFNDSLREEIRMVLLDDRRASTTEAEDTSGEIDDDYLEKLIAASESRLEETATPPAQQDKPNWTIPPQVKPKISEEDKKKAFFL